jgi:ceramide glucosyltransferase
MNLFAIIAATFVTTSLLYYAVATFTAIRFARRARQPSPALPKIAPRVAVLKPLHGRNQSLAGNLTSYLETDYPRAEFYFAVDGYDDPAAELPVALRSEYKFAQITMIVAEEPGYINRKVGKLVRMAERAPRAEIFVLSDADIAVSRDQLRRVVGELCSDKKIGVVTCIYRARPLGSLASRLEALFINTDFAPQVMLATEIEPLRYAFGATIAIKRETLEAIGGFQRLKDLLADDFYLGKFAADAGYDVRLSGSIVTTVCAERRLRDFWRRQLRWARTYRTTRPASLATIMLHGPSWALVFFAASGFSLTGVGVLVAVLVARIGMAAFVTRSILGLEGLGRDALLSPIKDLVMTAIWFASLVSNDVEWAGRRLRILRDGKMSEANG